MLFIKENANAVVSPTYKDFLLARVAGAFVAVPTGISWKANESPWSAS